MRRTVSAALVLTLLTASPALAGSPKAKGHRAGTIAKWTLIGVAAGFGIGFLHGMSANEHVPFAEEKTWRDAWLAALAGGVAGGVFGTIRSGAKSPVTQPAPATSLSSSPRLRLNAPSAQPDRMYRSLFRPTPFDAVPQTKTPVAMAVSR